MKDAKFGATERLLLALALAVSVSVLGVATVTFCLWLVHGPYQAVSFVFFVSLLWSVYLVTGFFHYSTLWLAHTMYILVMTFVFFRYIDATKKNLYLYFYLLTVVMYSIAYFALPGLRS